VTLDHPFAPRDLALTIAYSPPAELAHGSSFLPSWTSSVMPSSSATDMVLFKPSFVATVAAACVGGSLLELEASSVPTGAVCKAGATRQRLEFLDCLGFWARPTRRRRPYACRHRRGRCGGTRTWFNSGGRTCTSGVGWSIVDGLTLHQWFTWSTGTKTWSCFLMKPLCFTKNQFQIKISKYN
jgi:hypothetical protein